MNTTTEAALPRSSRDDHDGFTDSVIDRIRAEGTAWFGGTDWRGMRAMRISVCSWATQFDDVRKTIEAVRRVLAAS